MFSDLPGLGLAGIDRSSNSQWRYRAALPPGIVRELTLGEGRTPAVRTTIAECAVTAKLEWVNPTGSFKDRGVSVMMSALASAGVRAVLEDSSGNGGSSVAAYAALADIRARILAPETTSPAKLMQCRFHGAEVSLVPGSRQATADEAVRQSSAIQYASHNWHPYFVHGVKLLAYEIWEDLGFAAPDNVVVPAGSGSLVLGCHLGFGELLRAGLITRLPRIMIAQPAACCPLVVALDAGTDEVSQGAWGTTLAEGASIAQPVRDREVLAAIRESGGAGAAISEPDIAAATQDLARRGLYAEPTSALAAAAVPELVRRGALDPAETTVVVLTGSALKAAGAIENVLSTREAQQP